MSIPATVSYTHLEQLLSDLQNKSAASGERRGAVEAKLADMAARITDLKVVQASADSAREAAQLRLSLIHIFRTF